MAMIPRPSGRATARAGVSDHGATVLGRPPLPAAVPAPLGADEAFQLDAFLLGARRRWHDRLAEEEAGLRPEDAAGFAGRIGEAFDGFRHGALADLPTRLRPHAETGLTAVGEEIVGAARDYEQLAGRIGLFNTARQATDDLVALIDHDRDAIGRLRAEGLDRLARAPLSIGARDLLARHLDVELARAYAAAHVADDPAGAHASLMAERAREGGVPSPYDALSDEERQRHALRALIAGETRRGEAQAAEAERLTDAIAKGHATFAEIETSDLPVPEKQRLRDLLAARDTEELTASLSTSPMEAGAAEAEHPEGAHAVQQIFEDFEIDRAQLAALTGDVSTRELASWLRQIRAVKVAGSRQSRDPRELRQRILDRFGRQYTTASLLLDRLGKIIEGNAYIIRHPAMFPPVVVDRYVRARDRNLLVADLVTDFLPIVGDAKAALVVAGGLGSLILALRGGDPRLIRAAQRGLFLALVDLVPGPNVVGAGRKIVRVVNGLPIPASYKKEFHRAMWRQNFTNQRKWDAAAERQNMFDSFRHGRLDEEIVARAVERMVRDNPHKYKSVSRGVRYWTGPNTWVVPDFEIERVDGTKFLLETKVGGRRHKQHAGFAVISRGGSRRRYKRAKPSPPMRVKYLHRKSLPKGWRRTLWRIRNIGKD